jgi:DnaK suppressor protein
MKKEFIEELKQKLEKEKEILEKELEKFAKKDEKPAGDWDTKYPQFNGGNLEEEADEVEEYETLLQIEHSLETKLKDVNLALEKIKKGEYGICEKCGKEIDTERLKVMPEARICNQCK